MNSLVSIDYDEFMRFENEELLKHIFPENLFQKMGKKHEYIKQVISALTKGQQSVFMFMTVYYHNECGWNLFLYGLSSKIGDGLIGKIKSGLEYLSDKKLLGIVIRVEERYLKAENINPNENLFEDLDEEYEKIKKDSLINATDYVKNHPEEFFVFRKKNF